MDKVKKTKEVITTFFNQLSNGCESIKCTCPDCASNANFDKKFSNASEIAQHALHLSSLADYQTHVCKGLNLFANLTQNPVFLINEELKKVLESNDKDATKSVFTKVFSDPNYFPYLILSKNEKLSSDLSVNDSDFEKFIQLISNSSDSLEEFHSSFNLIIQKFCENPSPTFYFLRFIFVAMCFDNFLISTEQNESAKLLFRSIKSIETKDLKYLKKAFSRCPSVLQNALMICQTFLSIIAKDPVNEFVENISFFIGILHEASLSSEHPLPYSSFCNEPLTRKFEENDNDMSDSDDESYEPFIPALSLSLKGKYIQYAWKENEDLYFPQYFELFVSRENIVEEAINIISQADAAS